MLDRIKKYLKPRAFADEEQDRIAHLLHISLLTVFTGGILGSVVGLALGYFDLGFGFGVMAAGLIVPIVLLQHGHLRVATWSMLLMLLAALIFVIYVEDGVHDVAILLLPVAILIAGLLLRRSSLAAYSMLVLLSIGGIVVGELTGLIHNRMSHFTAFPDLVAVVVMISTTAVIVYLLSNNIGRSFAEAYRNRHDLIKGSDKLQREITERERMAELVRQERDRAQSYLDVAGVMFIAIDANHSVSLINQRGCEVLGYEEEEIIGKNWFDTCIPKRQRDEVRRVFDRLMAGKIEPVEYYENPVVTRSGEERIIAWHNTVLTDAAGKRIATLGSGEDITERVHMAEAVRKERDRAQMYLDVAGSAVVAVDSDGIVTLTNRKNCEILGYEEDEIIGKDWFDNFIPERIRVEARAGFEEFMAGEGGPLLDYDNYVLNRMGEERLITWHNVALRDDEGRIAGFLASGEDITLQARAEQALRESEERLFTLLDAIPSGVVVIDAETHIIVDVNPAAAQMIGAPAEEVIGHVCHDYICPAERGRCPITDLGQRVDNSERVLIRADGTRMPVLKTVLKVMLDGRQRLLDCFVDITDRKKAEEALRKSEKRFRTLFDGVPVGVYRTTSEGRILDANPALAEMLGCEDREALLGADANAWYANPADRQEWVNAIDSQGVLHGAEMEMRRADGTAIWVRDSAQAFRNGDGHVLHYEGMLEDVTESKRAEEERRWRTALDAALSALYEPVISPSASIEEIADTVLGRAKSLTDSPHGYVATVEPGTGDLVVHTFSKMLKGACQVTGENRRIAFPRGSDGRYAGLWGRSLETRTAFYTNSATAHPAAAGLPEGHIAVRRFLSVPVLMEEELVGQISLANPDRDYTDRDIEAIRHLGEFYALAIQRLRAEEKVHRYAEELSRSNEEIKNFAYIVSHDLRAPLVNLKGFSAELRSAVGVIDSTTKPLMPQLGEEQRQAMSYAIDEDVPEALGFIESSVEHMDEFLSAVLQLSRLGRRQLIFEEVDVETVVQTVLGSLAHQLKEHQVKVTVGDLPTVVADRMSVEQAMNNLLSNAVKYLEPERPGEITITGERRGEETIFYVRDNGRGIKEEDMPKVFMPFRRLGRQDTPGAGVGLSYAETLVRRHGGRIGCESTYGVGSTFHFAIADHLGEKDADE